jgi:hypothetical protein
VTRTSRVPAITLLTHRPTRLPGTLDHALRGALRRPRAGLAGGPATVYAGLLEGLRQIAQPHNADPPTWRASEDLGVLAGAETLAWAVDRRRTSRVRRLVAGPNIVVLPSYASEVIDWRLVDRVVVPSEWTRHKWIDDTPLLEDKVVVWSAGVDERYWCPGPTTFRDGLDILVYDKTRDPEFAAAAEAALVETAPSYEVIRYSAYRPEHFRDLLRRSRAMLFLSASESQGLALFEAWACDVPTLVWDRRLWIDKSGRRRWEGASSAPYLSAATGLAFETIDEFPSRLSEFWARIDSFRPREFILENHTLAKAAERYVQLFA